MKDPDVQTMYVLVGLTLIATVLRLYHLGINSLWIDEAWSLFASSQPWHLIPFSDIHPPLYYWLLKIGVMVFGQDEWGIRMVSALLGIIAVPLTYLLGKEIAGRNIGLFAAAMMTFSPMAIYYSQEARMYTLVMVLFILFMIMLLRGLREQSLWQWLALAVVSALVQWTHYFMVVPVLVVWLFLLVHNNEKPVWFGFLAYLVYSFPLIIPFTKALYTKVSLEGSTAVLTGIDIIIQPIIHWSSTPSYFAAFFVIFAAFGVINLLFKQRKEVVDVVLVLFATTFIGAYALSFMMMIHERYFLFLLPLFFILIGCGLLMVISQISTRDRTTTALIAILFVAISAVPLADYYTTPQKADWSGHNQVVQDFTYEGDSVALLVNRGYYELFTYYYDNKTDMTEIYQFASLSGLKRVVYGSHNNTVVFLPSDEIPEEILEAKHIMEFVNATGTRAGEHGGFTVYRIPYGTDVGDLGILDNPLEQQIFQSVFGGGNVGGR